MGHEVLEMTIVTSALVILHPCVSRKLWNEDSILAISLKALEAFTLEWSKEVRMVSVKPSAGRALLWAVMDQGGMPRTSSSAEIPLFTPPQDLCLLGLP